MSGDRSLRRRARRSYLTARRNGVAGRRTDGQAGVASAALAEQRQVRGGLGW